MIPKIIWQTHQWKKDKIPYPLNKAQRIWENLYLNWDYNYCDRFDRMQMVKELRPDSFNQYMDLNKIQQADYWRYLVLYEYGGLYVDADMIPTGAGLQIFEDELAEYSLIIQKDKTFMVINAFIFAEPKHPTLKNIVDNYFELIELRGFDGAEMEQIWGESINNTKDQDSILYKGFGMFEITETEFPYNQEISYGGKMVKYSDIDWVMRD